jgi:hypothetical protein
MVWWENVSKTVLVPKLDASLWPRGGSCFVPSRLSLLAGTFSFLGLGAPTLRLVERASPLSARLWVGPKLSHSSNGKGAGVALSSRRTRTVLTRGVNSPFVFMREMTCCGFRGASGICGVFLIGVMTVGVCCRGGVTRFTGKTTPC